MTKDYERQVEDDNTYKVGDVVTVLWTNSGSTYGAKGIIAKINTKSILVSLSEELRHSTGCLYPIGQRIKAPRIMTKGWTWSDRVYKPVRKEEEEQNMEIAAGELTAARQ